MGLVHTGYRWVRRHFLTATWDICSIVASGCGETGEASSRLSDTRGRHNGQMTDLALLAAEVGVSERTLRRALNERTLRASRPTPRTLELALAERLYIRRSWTLLSSLRGALRTEQNVRFALLFGSAATGTDTVESDIDLLVHLRDASLDRTVDLSLKLTAVIGRPVDLIRMQDIEADPSFLSGVLSNGRVLVDRDGLWPCLSGRAADLRRRAQALGSRRTDAALAGIDRLLGSSG